MNTNKPIRRNKNLLVFSHEHQHGLVFCTRLNKSNQTDANTLRAFVTDFWEKELLNHFRQEEKLLLPILYGTEIGKQFISEHEQIKTMVQCIKNSNNKSVFDNAITLSKVINDHIRFEERTLFPWIEKALTPKNLDALGKELENIEVTAHHFTPEFWK